MPGRRGNDSNKPPSAAQCEADEPDGPSDGQQRSKRAEVLGAMAAGVAHEFNNLLTIVLGSLEQLHRQPLDAHGQEQLQRAEWGVRQAGRLGQQVLSFIRRERRRETDIADLNAVLGAFDKMLGHVAGEEVKLVMDLAEHPLPVRLDPGQLEMAMLNLVRNSAHAMSGGGRIILRTCEQPANSPDDQPLVEVSVADTGTGIPREVVDRATDPFFATKEPGPGTGLGLWMVQRFVRACKGKLEIETAVGQGTTIRLLFPRGTEVQPTRS